MNTFTHTWAHSLTNKDISFPGGGSRQSLTAWNLMFMSCAVIRSVCAPCVCVCVCLLLYLYCCYLSEHDTGIFHCKEQSTALKCNVPLTLLRQANTVWIKQDFSPPLTLRIEANFCQSCCHWMCSLRGVTMPDPLPENSAVMALKSGGLVWTRIVKCWGWNCSLKTAVI